MRSADGSADTYIFTHVPIIYMDGRYHTCTSRRRVLSSKHKVSTSTHTTTDLIMRVNLRTTIIHQPHQLLGFTTLSINIRIFCTTISICTVFIFIDLHSDGRGLTMPTSYFYEELAVTCSSSSSASIDRHRACRKAMIARYVAVRTRVPPQRPELLPRVALAAVAVDRHTFSTLRLSLS